MFEGEEVKRGFVLVVEFIGIAMLWVCFTMNSSEDVVPIYQVISLLVSRDICDCK